MAQKLDFRTRLIRVAGPGCLAGITLQDWIRLLAENQFSVSFSSLLRAAYLTMNSCVTTVGQGLDPLFYGQKMRSVEVQSPLFILGAWRSGTTHLHNLICIDRRFAAPNLFQTMYPHTFLVNEPIFRPMMEVLTPRQRFMDSMKMSMEEPAEDEMALGILSLKSDMLSWVFPRNAARYNRFLTFENATENEREKWKRSLELFVRKVTVRFGKTLAMKSPNHTARIKLLLEVYPQAKFLCIHRHPFDVFRSMCHMARMVMPVLTLQHVPKERIPEIVIDTCQRLYNAYFDQVGLIPSGNIHEIRYENLIANPLSELDTAYQKLRLFDFDVARPEIELYIQRQATYQKNEFRPLETADRERVVAAWKLAFEKWEYSTE